MSDTDRESRMESLLRALEESQQERDTLRAENAALRQELSTQASWEPLGHDGERCTAVCRSDGSYDIPWIAIFRDRFRGEQYAQWARTTLLPEDEPGAECYPLDCGTAQVRLDTEKVAFWNDFKVAPVGAVRSVADVIAELGGDK